MLFKLHFSLCPKITRLFYISKPKSSCHHMAYEYKFVKGLHVEFGDISLGV